MTSAFTQLARTVLPRQASPEVFTRGLGGVAPPEVTALPPIVVRFEHHQNAEQEVVAARQRPAFEIEVMLVAFPPAAAAGEPLWFAYARSSATPARVLCFRCERDADPRRAVVAQGDQAASVALVESWPSRHAGTQDGPFQYEFLTFVLRAIGAGDSTPLASAARPRKKASRGWLWIVGVLAAVGLVVGGWAMFVKRGKVSESRSVEQGAADNERVRGLALALSVDKPAAFACTTAPSDANAPSLFVAIPPDWQGRAERRTEVGMRRGGPGTGSAILGQVIDLGEPTLIPGESYTARMTARVVVELVELTPGGDGTLARSNDASCAGVVSGSFLVSTTPGGIETSLHTAIDNLVRMAVCRTRPGADCKGYERGGVELTALRGGVELAR